MNVTGRFAPSPSGRMHLGNVFTALLAWLYARKDGGRLLLRIEDLDPARCKPAYAAQILNDLRWLGLDWDLQTQNQSQRTQYYAAAFEQLEKKGLLYPCYCARSALHAASAPHASDGTPVYAGTCRNMTPAQRAGQTKPPAWRILVPDAVYGFLDGLQGWQEENLARACGDFVVRRADGVYAYQLAVVVDDAQMGVTQVVRGRDLLTSTPRQLYLFEQLGYTPPSYVHVPLLLAEDGRRLSKRDADLDLGALRQTVRPEKILGTLGYLAGILQKPEPISPQELLQTFSPQTLCRENRVFARSLLEF